MKLIKRMLNSYLFLAPTSCPVSKRLWLVNAVQLYIYKVVATSLLSLITVQNPTPVQKFTRQTRIKSVAGVTHNSQHAWPQTRCLVDGIAMHILNTRQWWRPREVNTQERWTPKTMLAVSENMIRIVGNTPHLLVKEPHGASLYFLKSASCLMFTLKQY